MLLVTGITGHTGRYFLQELIKNGYKNPIRCIVRESSDTSILDSSNLNIEKMIGDINDEDFLNQCMKGVNTIVHIVNIRHTLNVLKAAINNRVSRVICVHTTGIYSNFRIASDEYIKIENKLNGLIDTPTTQIKITILRPTMIYGDLCDRNMSKFIKMIDKMRIFPVINNGDGLIQPVNARDLGKAYFDVLMLDPDNTRLEYNLSGEKPIKMKYALTMISENLGKRTIFISVPLGLGVFLARFLKIVTLGRVDYIERVQRMSEDRCFSHDNAKVDFGYKPESFEYGIAREVQQYLNKGK